MEKIFIPNIENITDYSYEIQTNRKISIQKVIDQFCDGNVAKFCAVLDKHPSYIYRLLRDVKESNSLKVTTKMSRLIEEAFKLPKFYLDSNLSLEEYAATQEWRDKMNNDIDIVVDYNFIPYMNTKPQFLSDSRYRGFEVNDDIFINFKSKNNFIVDKLFHTQIMDDSMSPRLRKDGYAIFKFFDRDTYPNYDEKFLYDILEDKAIYLIQIGKLAKFFRLDYRIYAGEFQLRFDNPLFEDGFNSEIYNEGSFLKSGLIVIGKVVGYFELDDDFK